MKKYKTVILDLDNTIVLHDYSNEIADLANKFHIPCSKDFKKQCVSLLNDYTKFCYGKPVTLDLMLSIIKNLVPILSNYSITPEIFLETWRNNDNSIYSSASMEALKYLKKQKYNIVAFTDWFTEDQSNTLKKLGYLSYFNTIYGWDNNYCKPDIRGLSNIVKGNPKSEYILIGDSLEKDIQCANSFGIDSIWFNPDSQKNSSSIAPTYTISSITDIKNYL
ncbi:MAG: HAD family hydrolase [Clostridia bacterium]